MYVPLLWVHSSASFHRYLQCMPHFVCLFLSILPLIPTMYASFCIFIPFHLPIGTFNVCPLLNVHSFASIPRWSTCIALRIRNQRLGKNFQFHFDGKSSSLVFPGFETAIWFKKLRRKFVAMHLPWQAASRQGRPVGWPHGFERAFPLLWNDQI